MKAYFGNFLTIIALLLLSIGARASGTVTIIRQLEGTLNADVGSVTMRVDDGICHVTVTPAAGYYLAPDRIRVMKTIDSGMAQARSLVPAYSGDIMVTAVTPQAGPREPSAYTFPMPSEEYDVEVRLDFQPLSNLKYNLVVEGVQVNEANRFNILTEEVATVFFDSKNTLVLKNAQLRQGIVSTLDSLRIVLMGESSIVTAAGVPIQSDYSQAQAPLVFTTVPSSPGTLTLQQNDDCFLSGFAQPTYEYGLQMGSVTGDHTVCISDVVPIVPILNAGDGSGDDKPSTDVSLTDDDFKDGTSGDNIDLSNTEINNVLYTIPEESGGYVEASGEQDTPAYIELKVSMTQEEVEVTGDMVPGSMEYADAFKGITLMLPSGKGEIVVEAETEGSARLLVKIGDSEPIEITNVTFGVSTHIPYECVEPTLVQLYHGGNAAASRAQRAVRREKVETAHVRISKLNVTSNAIVVENALSDNPQSIVSDMVKVYSLSDDNFVRGRKGIVISQLFGKPITGLGAGIFDDVENKDEIDYVDCSGSAIQSTGGEAGSRRASIQRSPRREAAAPAGRLQGLMSGFDDHTLVFLPKGNDDGGDVNIIIDGHCNRLALFDGKSFDTPFAFSADDVTFDRAFASDEWSTLCLPFSLDREQLSVLTDRLVSVKQAVAYDADNFVVTLDTVGSMKAHLPYIVKSRSPQLPLAGIGEVQVQANADMPVVSVGGLSLQGTLTGCTLQGDASYYLLNGSIPCFERVGHTAQVLPFQAWLTLDNGLVASLGIVHKGEETTGIRESDAVSSKASDSRLFDLQGRQVTHRKLSKGLYIWSSPDRRQGAVKVLSK